MENEDDEDDDEDVKDQISDDTNNDAYVSHDKRDSSEKTSSETGSSATQEEYVSIAFNTGTCSPIFILQLILQIYAR